MSQFIDSSSIANRLWFDFSTFVGCKRLDAKYCPCPLWQHRRLLVLADDSWQIVYIRLSFILVTLWTKSLQFEDIRGHSEHVSHCFGHFGRLMVKSSLISSSFPLQVFEVDSVAAACQLWSFDTVRGRAESGNCGSVGFAVLSPAVPCLTAPPSRSSSHWLSPVTQCWTTCGTGT